MDGNSTLYFNISEESTLSDLCDYADENRLVKVELMNGLSRECIFNPEKEIFKSWHRFYRLKDGVFYELPNAGEVKSSSDLEEVGVVHKVYFVF